MGKIMSQHVIPSPSGGWCVKKSGSDKATKIFKKKIEAIEFARKISIHQGAELYIHGRDGMIQQKSSYGNDPLPPKDI